LMYMYLYAKYGLDNLCIALCKLWIDALRSWSTD